MNNDKLNKRDLLNNNLSNGDMLNDELKDLEISYAGMVYPTDTDHMSHANVRYYSRAFNEASYFMFSRAGITREYMGKSFCGMACIEEHTYYKREINPGDQVLIRSCFIDFTEKWLHVWNVMVNRNTSDICAVNDQRCIHFDRTKRKSKIFPKQFLESGLKLVRKQPIK
tara:strand:+ start:1909 stop:2415 length:507 start_codon:yes stop_codon:yes gene_type:complete